MFSSVFMSPLLYYIYRFLLDELWLDDLHAYLVEPLSCAATDFGRMASILGCISAFTLNKAMEALDTNVLVRAEGSMHRLNTRAPTVSLSILDGRVVWCTHTTYATVRRNCFWLVLT